MSFRLWSFFICGSKLVLNLRKSLYFMNQLLKKKPKSDFQKRNSITQLTLMLKLKIQCTMDPVNRATMQCVTLHTYRLKNFRTYLLFILLTNNLWTHILHDSTAVYKKSVNFFDQRNFLKTINLYQNHSKDLEFSQYKLHCEIYIKCINERLETLERCAKYWPFFLPAIMQN